MGKKLSKINGVNDAVPTKIIVFERDEEGEHNEIGTLDWMDDHWEPNFTDPNEWISEMLDTGMAWGGKVYYGKDREFYLPLVNSNYTAYAFKGE